MATQRSTVILAASEQTTMQRIVSMLLWYLTDTRHMRVPLPIAAARNSRSLIGIKSGIAGDITCGVSRGGACFLC